MEDDQRHLRFCVVSIWNLWEFWDVHRIIASRKKLFWLKEFYGSWQE